MASEDDDDDELLLVHQLPMDMEDHGDQGRRLAHLLPPLASAPASGSPPPFRPPPPPAAAAAAAAESRISFRGWLGAPRHWELWVAKLRPIHERQWRELGILDAVLASTYRFKRDPSAVLHIASFWCSTTNTFAFPWGEATLTLQDMAVLGGFPADGSPAPAPLPPEWRPDEAALNGVRLGFNRSACKKAHHSAWVKHFLMDMATATAADEVVLEHAGFLALWLTRFVLPGQPESTMRQSLFPLAVRLARGERVALAPAVLASLYRDLREMKDFLAAAGAAATGELLPPLSVYAPLYILQLWVWERFPAFWAGKAILAKDGEPRAARWHDMSKKVNPVVIREVLTSGKNYVWQPYTSSLQQRHGWLRGSDVAGSDKLRSFVHCLRACELVGMDCIEQYLPHRVAMQFGLDQDVPGDVQRANENWVVAWKTYDLEGKNVAFFIPQSEPGVTAQYVQWWKQPLSPNLDVGAASIALEWKVSKRKVKKTPAAMEAEAEKERKMKKARISPNDKKRKLEELYDAKLSDCLSAARNESSGIGGGCKEKSHETPQAERVECGEQSILMDSEIEHKKVHQSMKEGDDIEVEKYLKLANKYTEEMAMEITEVEKAELEQRSIVTKGCAEEEHKEIPKVEHGGLAEPKIHTQSDTEKYAEMDVANRLTGRDADEKPINVPELGHAEKEKARVLIEEGTDEKLIEVSEVDVPKVGHAEKEKTMVLIEEGTDEKLIEVSEVDVPEAGHADKEKARVLIEEGTDEKLIEVSEVDVPKAGHAEKEKARTLIGEGTDEKLTEVSEVDVPELDHVEKEKARVLVEEDSDEKLTEVSEVDVPEVGHAEKEKVRVLVEDSDEKDSDEKLTEVSEVDVPEVGHAEKEKVRVLVEEDSDEKLTEASEVDVPEVGHAEKEKARVLIEESSDEKLTEVSEVDFPEVAHAEKEKARVLIEEGAVEKLAEVSEVGHVEVEEPRGLIKEGMDEKFEEVPELENIGIGGTPETMEKDADDKLNETHGTIELAKEGQDDVLTGSAKYGYIGKISLVEQVDPKEPAQAQRKKFDKDIMEASVGKDTMEASVHKDTVKASIDKDTMEVSVDKDTVESSNSSTGAVMSCNSAITQSEENQKEALHENMKDKECIEGVEFVNESEPSSNAAAIKVEALDMHEEVVIKVSDHGIICENKQTRLLENSHMLDNSLESGLVVLEADEIDSTEGIPNQETLDLDKQQTIDERHDLGTTVENKKTKGSEDANMLGYGEFHTDSPGTEVNEVKSTKGIHDQEHLDVKEEQAMEKTIDYEITGGDERPLEDTNALDNVGVDTIAVAVGVSEATSDKGMENHDVCSTDELLASEDKQQQGVAKVNESRILKDTCRADSGEPKSDATIVVVDGAEPREGTHNQVALSIEKEPAVQGKQGQGMADENPENAKRILVDMDGLECVGVKPDGTKIAQEPLSEGKFVNLAGDKSSLKNLQEGVPLDDHNKSDVKGSESTHTARKEFDEALPLELENQVEVKQEKLENITEKSIGRCNDEASEQYETSPEEATVAPSAMDDQGENNKKEWAEESIKNYDKYASDPVSTSCQPSKCGRPSIEEVRRIHIGRSIYMKDIKESQGRIRPEPSNRIQINNAGYFSRHAVQEPVSVSKDIKVPLHDSPRVYGRDHAPELVVTGPPEETSRWRQEQCALQILEDVQNSRIAERTRMEMEIRILKAQIATMQKQVMNLDHIGEAISRSKSLKRH